MALVLAVLRSVFLIFFIGFAARGLPTLNFHLSRTFDEQYSMCSNNAAIMQSAILAAFVFLLADVAWSWYTALALRRKTLANERPAPPAVP